MSPRFLAQISAASHLGNSASTALAMGCLAAYLPCGHSTEHTINPDDTTMLKFNDATPDSACQRSAVPSPSSRRLTRACRDRTAGLSSGIRHFPVREKMMLINPDEVVTGALVNAIAVVGRQIGKAVAGLRKTNEDLATARWFETFRLTGALPDLPGLSPASWPPSGHAMTQAGPSRRSWPAPRAQERAPAALPRPGRRPAGQPHRARPGQHRPRRRAERCRAPHRHRAAIRPHHSREPAELPLHLLPRAARGRRADPAAGRR